MNYTVKSISHGVMLTNTYLVIGEDGSAFVVDPACYDEKLVSLLKENNVQKLTYILLTHGHFDHITGTQELKESFGGKIVIHKDDEKALTDANYSLAFSFGVPSSSLKADITVSDGDSLPFSNGEISVLHTPGHTEGGVCYLFSLEMFSGDTLFKESMGRTDFPGGNMLTLLKSLKKLCLLEKDYSVHAGHGESTALSYEKQNNPFCRV